MNVNSYYVPVVATFRDDDEAILCAWPGLGELVDEAADDIDGTTGKIGRGCSAAVRLWDCD